jgi:hypothetical protein
MVIRRVFGAVWARTEGNPFARGAFLLASGAAAAFLGYTWWPNGDYRPIQPGERGTIQGAVLQFENVSSGRPGLTRAREAALGGAPLLSSVPAGATPAGATTTTTTTTTTTSTDTTATETTTTETTQTDTNTGVTVSTPAATATVTTTPTTTTP